MMPVCLYVCMYVCGLITQERLNRLGSNSQRVFSLVPGWFQARKIWIRLPVRWKTGKNRFSMVFHKWSFALFLKLQRVLMQLGGAQPHPTPNAAGCQRRSPLVYNKVSKMALKVQHILHCIQCKILFKTRPLGNCVREMAYLLSKLINISFINNNHFNH